MGFSNKVSSISQSSAPGVYSYAGASLWAAGSSLSTFEYDSSNNRIRQILTRAGNGLNATTFQRITTYVGSYEREEHYNSSNVLWQIRHRHSVGGFLQIKRTETSGQSGITEEKSYFLKDHLGSVTAVLDASGSVVERPSFDAWGKTRDADTWADVDASSQWLSSNYTNRGYTGHEQLDEVGLVHMNGRIYDPESGRFLSPDPYIQDPEHSQNFNRYTYVLNNPLSYNDPSGHFFVALFAAAVKFTVAAVVAVVKAAVAIGKFVHIGVKAFLKTGLGKFLFGKPAGFWSGVAKGATWGGLNSARAGGGFKDILRGALVGAVTAGLTVGLVNKIDNYLLGVAGHGVVGGISNVAMGGKFGDGFYSAAAGQALPSFQLGDGVYARTVSAGIIGGTVAAVGGGKFANGAYTAAFMHLMAEAKTDVDTVNRDRVQAKWFYPNGDPNLARGVDGHGITGSHPDSHYQQWADDHQVAVFHIYSEGGISGGIQDIGEVAVERLLGGIGSKVVERFISGYEKLPEQARMNISTHSQGVSPVVAAMFRRPALFKGAHIEARSSSVYSFRIAVATTYSGSSYTWSMPKGADIANSYASMNPLRIAHALINPIRSSINHSYHSTEYKRMCEKCYMGR